MENVGKQRYKTGSNRQRKKLSSVRTKLSHNKMVKTNDVYEDIASDVDKF